MSLRPPPPCVHQCKACTCVHDVFLYKSGRLIPARSQGPRASREDDVVLLGPASERGTGTQTDISGYLASSKSGTRAGGSSAEMD